MIKHKQRKRETRRDDGGCQLNRRTVGALISSGAEYADCAVEEAEAVADDDDAAVSASSGGAL